MQPQLQQLQEMQPVRVPVELQLLHVVPLLMMLN
jgi:hypothetical protein